MRKYKLKELRELVRLGVAENYTNKPSEYIYTLRRLESYLSHHFPEWVSRWANSPEDLAAEMKEFARMEI